MSIFQTAEQCQSFDFLSWMSCVIHTQDSWPPITARISLENCAEEILQLSMRVLYDSVCMANKSVQQSDSHDLFSRLCTYSCYSKSQTCYYSKIEYTSSYEYSPVHASCIKFRFQMFSYALIRSCPVHHLSFPSILVN